MKVIYIMFLCAGLIFSSSLVWADDEVEAKAEKKGPTCEQKLAQATETNSVQGDYINRLLKVRSQQEASGISSERIIKAQQELIADLKNKVAKLTPKEKSKE